MHLSVHGRLNKSLQIFKNPFVKWNAVSCTVVRQGLVCVEGVCMEVSIMQVSCSFKRVVRVHGFAILCCV
jgi:hypothetical protein